MNIVSLNTLKKDKAAHFEASLLMSVDMRQGAILIKYFYSFRYILREMKNSDTPKLISH